LQVAQLDAQLQRESDGLNLALLTELLQTAEDVAHQTPAVQRARQRRSALMETVRVQDALGTALLDMTSAEACTEVEQMPLFASDCTDYI
jgi:hypothetical protein